MKITNFKKYQEFKGSFAEMTIERTIFRIKNGYDKKHDIFAMIKIDEKFEKKYGKLIKRFTKAEANFLNSLGKGNLKNYLKYIKNKNK